SVPAPSVLLFPYTTLFRSIFDAALGQLVKVLPAGPVLNWVYFFVRQYRSFLEDNREQHQAMLYYYLNAYTPEQWGLTEQEWRRRSEEHTSELQSRENLVCR